MNALNKSLAEAGFCSEYKMLINGKLVRAEANFPVYNPATNEVLAEAPAASASQVDSAIAAAKLAFPAWAALSWDERASYLYAYADAVEAVKEELATLLTLEQGKPRRLGAIPEVDGSIYWIREIASRRLKTEEISHLRDHHAEVIHTPLGVVGAITPWNYPVLLALWKVAPCLLTGNTLVLKPSPYTPLCTLRLGEIAQGIFPDGVINIVSGTDEIGPQMTSHPDIAKISFTGSSATGRRVMESSSANLKRLTLELGGNDPAILMPDADWEALVPRIFSAAFGNSGQWCIGTKRIYAHSSYHARFVKALADYSRTQKVGNGLEDDTVLGPVQNRMQYDKLRSLFNDVKENNYTVAVGGTIDENLPGNFVPVTIVDNPPENSRIVQEEPFGPIVPVIAYDDIDDVITKANASPFGLGCSVWGRDVDAATAVIRRLESGIAWVNDSQFLDVDLPFGGHKLSGLGNENGRQGLEEFTNCRTIVIRK